MKRQGATRDDDALYDAAKRLSPYLGRYASPWCRHVLFSTLHHTAMGVERDYQYGVPYWFRSDPWPEIIFDGYFEKLALQWCPQCLALAYHSTAHQLAGLTHCPLHNARIRTGCARCGFPLPLQSPEYRAMQIVPFRDCPHCREPILGLAGCSAWPKTQAFLMLESDRLTPLINWTRRVARLGRREFPQTEDARPDFSKWNDALAARIAVEAWLPLPRQIRVKRPKGLRTVCVWIDAGASTQFPVLDHDIRAVFRSVRHYLARLPLPPGWELSWRSGEPLRPRPRTAGESDYFELWLFLHERADGTVVVSRSPDEVCTPSMLKLWAHRLLRDFDYYAGRRDMKRSATFPVYAVSTFFTTDYTDLMAPLGTAKGLIVESYYRRYVPKD